MHQEIAIDAKRCIELLHGLSLGSVRAVLLVTHGVAIQSTSSGVCQSLTTFLALFISVARFFCAPDS